MTSRDKARNDAYEIGAKLANRDRNPMDLATMEKILDAAVAATLASMDVAGAFHDPSLVIDALAGCGGTTDGTNS